MDLCRTPHTCSSFEQHQAGHWDDWEQPLNEKVKLKSTGLQLEIMGQPDWTDTSNLRVLRNEKEVCHLHRHTQSGKKKEENNKKKEKAKPQMPCFCLVALICCFSPKQGIYLKTRKKLQTQETTQRYWEGQREVRRGRRVFWSVKLSWRQIRGNKNAEMDFWCK